MASCTFDEEEEEEDGGRRDKAATLEDRRRRTDAPLLLPVVEEEDEEASNDEDVDVHPPPSVPPSPCCCCCCTSPSARPTFAIPTLTIPPTGDLPLSGSESSRADTAARDLRRTDAVALTPATVDATAATVIFDVEEDDDDEVEDC